MDIFKTKIFWDWLYTGGNTPLTDEVFTQLKTDYNYGNQEIVSELGDETYTWNFETVLIDLPITNAYSICSLLQLNGTAEFEENIYLKHNQDYYPLGWIDSHNHEMIFRLKEFYQVIDFLKNSPTTNVQWSASVLFLARLVTLTNEVAANQLMQDCIAAYTEICSATDTIIPKITKSSMYGNKIYGTDLVFKIKTIRTPKHPLRFTINEGISWMEENERFNLHGFGVHSMRNKRFDKGLVAPIDLYNVKANMEDYSFPYGLWTDMLNQTEQK